MCTAIAWYARPQKAKSCRCWLSDGMPWFEERIVPLFTKDMVVVLDVYHLLERAADMAKAVFAKPDARQRWYQQFVALVTNRDPDAPSSKKSNKRGGPRTKHSQLPFEVRPIDRPSSGRLSVYRSRPHRGCRKVESSSCASVCPWQPSVAPREPWAQREILSKSYLHQTSDIFGRAQPDATRGAAACGMLMAQKAAHRRVVINNKHNSVVGHQYLCGEPTGRRSARESDYDLRPNADFGLDLQVATPLSDCSGGRRKTQTGSLRFAQTNPASKHLLDVFS